MKEIYFAKFMGDFMVKEEIGWILEEGDEIVVYKKDSKRIIAEGTVRGIYCGIVSSIEKGLFNNGSFVLGINLNHKDKSVHGYSFDLYKFKLKNDLKNIDDENYERS